jgi:regulatory protein
MSERGLKQCRASAMNLLARREHSVKELHQKLLSRDFEAEVVDAALMALIAERLLSNDRFVESYVRSKINSGIGPLRLRQELREHGIASDEIEASLRGHEWRRLAVEVRQKRFGAALPDKYEERAKQMRFLQYRGFNAEQISSAMKQQDEWE